MKKHGISDWHQLIKKANGNIEWYWNAVNEDLDIEWFQKYENVCDHSLGLPWTKWFINGKCNIISNAIDRHAKAEPNKIAYIFANEFNSKKISYNELNNEVGKLAVALSNAGVSKGDVVGIYLSMAPEAFFSIFACSKIGAVHTTIFSGFSEQALHSRLVDSKAKVLITTDTIRRRGKDINLKSRWINAVQGTNVSKVISINHTSDNNNNNIDIVDYSEFIKDIGKGTRNTKTLVMNSEDPLFILYTSGTTGTPKGTLQVHGGFTVVAAQQTAYLIDMKPSDVLFWYADIGWITGQVWVVYGSPIIGGTALVYDDALDHPKADTWCSLIENYKVTIFGAAPTAIRLFMKEKLELDNNKYNFSSLRMLASTGEPINKEAWIWYFEKVGKKRCPIINLSGGTEAGGAILSALPVMSLKPCTVGCAVPGFDVDVFDNIGRSIANKGIEGYLVIKKPWPSMTRGLLNDPDRFLETYWSKYKDIWYHGDIVIMDSNGLWYVRGRADDIIKVSGHRIGAVEIEAAVMSHPVVAEAVAVGKPNEITGESIIVYIVIKDKEYDTLKNKDYNISLLKTEILARIEKSIGRFARPEDIRIVAEIPKTRTGKILRRLVRAKIAGDNISQQDLSIVENPWSLETI
jgi:acetyl-CoA synthetase